MSGNTPLHLLFHCVRDENCTREHLVCGCVSFLILEIPSNWKFAVGALYGYYIRVYERDSDFRFEPVDQ